MNRENGRKMFSSLVVMTTTRRGFLLTKSSSRLVFTIVYQRDAVLKDEQFKFKAPCFIFVSGFLSLAFLQFVILRVLEYNDVSRISLQKARELDYFEFECFGDLYD